MKASAKEIKLDLCNKHKNVNLAEFWPGYVFAEHLSFPSRDCKAPDCEENAYYTVVGVLVPDAMGVFVRENGATFCRGTIEIFDEAKHLLDNGNALDRLTYYLRTRIVPSECRDFLANKLIRIFASMVLSRLKIDPTSALSHKDKHRILLELKLYPEDFE